MGRPKYDVYAARCPTRQALDRIADKWTALIIGLLGQRTHRFGELRRGIEGISHKVLTQMVRSLERDGLVLRVVCPTVPTTVEYSLTPLGRTLVDPLASIRDWAEQHIDEVEEARAAYVASAPTLPRSKASQPESERVRSAAKADTRRPGVTSSSRS